MNKIIFILVILLFSQCENAREKEKKNRQSYNRNTALFSILQRNQITSDCIYCDNTRAFNGNCTCYFSIPLATCDGMNAGTGKSNSTKISCSELVSTGVWAIHSDTLAICNYTGCPPEAYRAAFTAYGR